MKLIDHIRDVGADKFRNRPPRKLPVWPPELDAPMPDWVDHYLAALDRLAAGDRSAREEMRRLVAENVPGR